jgi:3-oxoacyl-[acyl-carrier protein] reductase
MDLGLRGRVALVTGASEGIGRAIARELLREGARVAICGRRADVLDAAADGLRHELPAAEVLAIAADVTLAEDVERLANGVAERYGPVEVLVNAVGHGHRAPFAELSEEAWREVLDVNLLATARITRRLLPAMLEAGWGRVINVAAVSGRQPTPGQMASNVAKAALINFTKSLADEVAQQGVTVNAVLPGRIASDRVLREFTPEQREQRARVIPMRRYGTTEEFAAAVAFLASTRASYITGAALAVDGGLVAAMF